jgi:hypothetical protein
VNRLMNKFIAAPLPKDDVIVRIAGLVVMALFFVAARFYNPFESELLGCQFKNLTGYDCPTCGLSRSIFLLMNFQIGSSINYHPLGVVVVVALFFFLLKFTAELILKKEITIPWGKNTMKIFIVTMTSLAAVNWFVKLCIELSR